MSGHPSGPSRHARHMTRALTLAEHGRATVSPNPMVGCVLVGNDEVVGEGWHAQAGCEHAEVLALRAAGPAARGATAYVTLEPCTHHGRTPPCSEALIQAGVARVVIAARDPDPRVDGAGAARLRAAGVEVIEGVLQGEAEAQNEAFLTSVTQGRPFVLYKTAMTLDGKISTTSGDARWITSPPSRARVQRWRHELDAVAVGVRTVLADDPRLTARVPDGRSPRKVVFDTHARTPPDAALFAPDARGTAARVLIVVGSGAPEARRTALRDAGADTLQVPLVGGRASVAHALAQLHEREVRSVLLEGGGTLAWSFFEADAVDRVAWFVAPKLLGGTGASPLGGPGVTTMADAFHLDALETETSGEDLLLTGRVARRAARSAPQEGRPVALVEDEADVAPTGRKR